MDNWEIKVSKIDYYSWKIGAIILLFALLCFIYFSNRNEYATPSGYIDSFIQTKDKGLCQARFSATCKPTIIVCESDVANRIDALGKEQVK